MADDNKPKTLSELGYSYNDQGQLRTLNGDPFKFVNQSHYEILGDLIVDEIHSRLKSLGLEQLTLPGVGGKVFAGKWL